MKTFLWLIAVTLTLNAQAKLFVVTTTSDLKAIAEEVGGAEVNVEAIAKGTQDPHYIEAKPSYSIKLNHADLVISIGLGLEIGWLPSILQLGRNPKVMQGNPGYLEVGPLVNVLEIPQGNVSRAEGDVHPEGNPHVTLDPIRMGTIAVKIAERMSELDPVHEKDFKAHATKFEERMAGKTKTWQARVSKTGVKKIITHHKTLTYFFDRFHLENPAILEPKPGIPPTTKHTLEIINLIKSQKIPLILIENFFAPSVADRIKDEVPSVKIKSVTVSVGGDPSVNSLDDLYESLVSAVEGK